jgi:hypothetical protein
LRVFATTTGGAVRRTGVSTDSLASAGLLALAIAAGGLVVTQITEDAIPVVLSLLLLGIVVIPPIVALLRRRLDVFEPVYVVLAFIAIQFPIQAIYVALVRGYDRPPLVGHERWLELINDSLLIAIVGTLAFLIGYYMPRQSAESLARALPLPRGEWDPRSLMLIVILLTCIGLAAIYYFMDRVGGLRYFLDNLYLHNELARGRYYLLWAFQLLPLASLVWFASLAKRKGRALNTPVFWLHFTVATALTASLGGRAQVLYLWEVLLVIYHYRVRRVALKAIAVFFVIATMFLFVAGSYRRSTASERPDTVFPTDVSPAAVANEVLYYDYSSLDIMVLLLDRVPDEIPLRWGRSFLDLVVLPVPRSVYADKPAPLNTWYSQQLFGAERGGKKASILGEGFVNFHIPGVLLIMLLYGFAARVLYTNLQLSDFGPGAVLVYALFYKFIWSLSGGGFGEISFELLMRLLPVLVIIHLVRIRVPRRNEASTSPFRSTVASS